MVKQVKEEVFFSENYFYIQTDISTAVMKKCILWLHYD
jgi:hypothetical protein